MRRKRRHPRGIGTVGGRLPVVRAILDRQGRALVSHTRVAEIVQSTNAGVAERWLAARSRPRVRDARGRSTAGLSRRWCAIQHEPPGAAGLAVALRVYRARFLFCPVLSGQASRARRPFARTAGFWSPSEMRVGRRLGCQTCVRVGACRRSGRGRRLSRLPLSDTGSATVAARHQRRRCFGRRPTVAGGGGIRRRLWANSTVRLRGRSLLLGARGRRARRVPGVCSRRRGWSPSKRTVVSTATAARPG
jgi:hypothetical protein